MMTRRLLILAGLLALATSPLTADPVVDSLVPLKPEVRKVINESCVMCHGEVINGEKETRDDIDYSTDDALRTTLTSAGKLKQVILEDKMPHKPRLSRRLRDNAELQARLAALRENYNKSGHKDVLLDWLKDVTATTGDDKKKE